MSDREDVFRWAVVREGNLSFEVVPVALAQSWIERGVSIVVVRRCAEITYADGFAAALNLAAKDRSVLPEWNG